jgi:glucan phosphoethanolaminetransferase (alkaline phosphatase superfamily)
VKASRARFLIATLLKGQDVDFLLENEEEEKELLQVIERAGLKVEWFEVNGEKFWFLPSSVHEEWYGERNEAI